MIGMIVRFECSEKTLPIFVPLLLSRHYARRGRWTTQVVDVSVYAELLWHLTVNEMAYKSTTQTSGPGRTLYLVSVARPRIHGPGSSIYILASRAWTEGKAIPDQPRNSTRYLIVHTAIYIRNSSVSR